MKNNAGWGIAIMVAVAAAGWATQPVGVEVTCPVDGAVFSAQKVISTTYSGEMDLDLTRLTHGFTPMAFSPWTCPRCYYTGLQDDFKSEYSTAGPVLTEAQKRGYRSGLTPALLPEAPRENRDFASWVRYDLYAQRLRIDHAPPFSVAEALHDAARVSRLTARFPPVDDTFMEKTDKALSKRLKDAPDEFPSWLGAARATQELIRSARTPDARLLALLIYQYHTHGEDAQALENLALFSITPGAPPALVEWARVEESAIRREMSFLERAIPVYEESLRQQENFNVRYLLGDLNRRLGRLAKMEEWFLSIKDVPDDAQKATQAFMAAARRLAGTHQP